MQYIVKGMFTMAVDAESAPEAKETAERILRHEGVKAVAVETTENEPKPRGGSDMKSVMAGWWRSLKKALSDIFALKLPDIPAPPTVYEARDRGREYCQTQGSDHYILPGVEAMDLIISLGYAEHFCLASIIKYAARYGEGGNVEDLKKIADYAHILCGVRLAENEGEGGEK